MCPRLPLAVFLMAGLPALAVAQSPVNLLHESFDTLTVPALPAGWSSSQNRSPGTNDFTSTTSAPRSLPNALLSTNATIAQEIRTPVLDFSAAQPESLSFFVRRSASHAARVVVEASTNGGDTFPFLVGDTLRGEASTGYVVHGARIPPVLAGVPAATLRWRVIPDPSGATGTFRIDDLAITGRRIDDLSLSAIRTVPPHPRQGDAVSVVITVINAGGRPAGAYTVQAFLDQDADSVADPGELLGEWSGAGGLAPGDSAAGSMPAGILSPGRHRLIGHVVWPADQDTSNNILAAECTVSYAGGSVIVNEIMYGPSGAEPEWVELMNVAGEPADLNGWTFADNTPGAGRTIASTTTLMEPGSFVVLARESTALYTLRPGMPHVVLPVSGFPALNNTGDAVILRDAGSAVMDSLQYTPDWGGEGGRSLERVDPQGTSIDPLNWATSQDTARATPGLPNSVVILDDDLQILRFEDQSFPPGISAEIALVVRNRGRRASGTFRVFLYDDDLEPVAESADQSLPAVRDSVTMTVLWSSPPAGCHRVLAVVAYPPDMRHANDTAAARIDVGFARGTAVINEIMAEPFAGRAEYIEVLNAGGTDIACKDWCLRGMSASAHVELPDSFILRAGRYLVVASDSSIFTSFPSLTTLDQKAVQVLDASLGLNNDGDNVVLADPTGNAVDSVAYTASWHNPDVDDHTGRSLERIRPSGGSNDARNWSTSASLQGGTPGAPNSIFTPVIPSSATLSASPNPFSPDNDGREDCTAVQYHLPAEVSVIRLRIYDVRGRLIRTLASGEPAGAAGEVIWDGMDDGRQRVRMGIYILLLDAMDSRGGVVISTRATVVVASRL